MKSIPDNVAESDYFFYPRSFRFYGATSLLNIANISAQIAKCSECVAILFKLGVTGFEETRFSGAVYYSENERSCDKTAVFFTCFDTITLKDY